MLTGWQPYGNLISDKIKWEFFQAVAMSVLLYGCSTWTLTKCLEKNLDGNYTRMLNSVLNNSWKQHTTKLQLYGNLPAIPKTIQVRWARYAVHCWRSKEELISDIFLWTHGHTSVGWPATTYIHHLCVDTGCRLMDG